jgi:DNA modification methylase
MELIRLLQGDSLSVLKTLPSCSVQCAVTSPPYYGLRDYGTAQWDGGDAGCDHNPARPDGGERTNRTTPLGRGGTYKTICGKCGAVRVDEQVGLEKTPDEYVNRLVDIFRELRRVLKDDGTLWLNLGDSYAGSWGAMSHDLDGKAKRTGTNQKPPTANKMDGIKPKDLIGIPWTVAFALRADGWYLRSEIIWHKPNPMPESVKDRPTKAHEQIFLLSKSAKYFYNAAAIAEPAKYPNDNRGARTDSRRAIPLANSIKGKTGETRNKRDVWTVTTRPYKEAHFATFPASLIEPCILAGSCPGDVVLDPFTGSSTTGEVSIKHRRRFIGID